MMMLLFNSKNYKIFTADFCIHLLRIKYSNRSFFLLISEKNWRNRSGWNWFFCIFYNIYLISKNHFANLFFNKIYNAREIFFLLVLRTFKGKNLLNCIILNGEKKFKLFSIVYGISSKQTQNSKIPGPRLPELD